MMYGSPQRQVGSSRHKTIPLKGLFIEGVWHCNCDPRLPAAHFLTRKEGPNKGKWFYTCQQSSDEGCSFFLWGDQAVGREMRAVITNTRSEPDPPSTSAAQGASDGTTTSNQWIQDLGKRKDDDEFGEWSQEDEEAIVQVAQRSIPGSYPETPRKPSKTTPILTPNSKRKRENPTPLSGSKGDDVFSIPSFNTLKFHDLGLRSPSITPTPNRFRNASVVSDRSENTNSYDITEEVNELLKDQHLDEKTSYSLRNLLNRHALKISGIAKGRDITRLDLKSKDNKIAELQQAINGLEIEREMDKAIIRQLTCDLKRSKCAGGSVT